jgi:predicted phage terminase large subunit-like protein
MLEGTHVLWPDRESYHDLMVMREREGRFAFQAEKQNEPLDPAQCVFTQTPIRYWDDEFKDEQALLTSIGSHWIIAGCDPSLGVKNGDYSAIVILAKSTTTKRCYVLAADIARRTPDQIVDRLCHYHQMYGIRRLAVESNQFQVMLVKQLKVRLRQQTRPMPSVTCLESRSNKGSRILSLEPELAQGRLIMNRSHKTLNDQLLAFPVAKHDDGPDALEMAMTEAAKYSGGCGRVNL